jgi:hypothetical protein
MKTYKIVADDMVFNGIPESDIPAFLKDFPNAKISAEGGATSDKMAKAQQLRAEGAKIREDYFATPEKTLAYTERMDQVYKDADEAKRKNQDMQDAQSLSQSKGGFGSANATLKQIGRSVPKLITSAYQAIVNPEDVDGDGKPDRLQTFADRYQLPYENELAQAVLGDPTLVPSMAIPGIGEAKVAQILQKGAKYSPKVVQLAKPTKYAIDAGVQAGVATGSGADFDEGMLMGVAGQGVPEVIGQGTKALGGKIIQGVVKPAKKLLNKYDVDVMMSAKNPDGSSVVKPFTTISGALGNTDESIKKWSDLQLSEIKRLSEQAGGSSSEFTYNMINDRIDNLVREITDKVGAGMTEDQAKRAIAIIEQERGTLLRNSPSINAMREDLGRFQPTGEPIATAPKADLESLHAQKQTYGDLGRFDVQNTATSDATARDAYKKLYGVARDAITDTEVHLREYASNPAYKEIYDTMKGMKDFNTLTWDKVQQLKKNMPENQEMINLANSMINRQTNFVGGRNQQIANMSKQLGEMRQGKSIYDISSKEMSPLITAQEVLEDAEGRTGKHNLLSLTGGLAGGAMYGASENPFLALGALLAPQMLQSMPTGTALYRGGEKLMQAPSASKYYVPAMIRAQDEE